jgi:hypothetical protein
LTDHLIGDLVLILSFDDLYSRAFNYRSLRKHHFSPHLSFQRHVIILFFGQKFGLSIISFESFSNPWNLVVLRLVDVRYLEDPP